MTGLILLSVISFVAYTLVLFGLSAFFIKRALNSYEEYTLCGRSLTIWFVILTYMGTWIGGGTIIGLAGSAYSKGVSQYWIFASSCLAGFFFALLFIKRIRKLRMHSIGDVFALRYPEYGEIIRIPVSLGLLIRNVTMVGMQFTALSFMFTYLFNIDRNLAILATFLIITGYTAMSGLWAVVVTDVFQGILQTVGMFILLCYSISANDGLENILLFYQEAGKSIQLSILGAGDNLAVILTSFLTFGLFFFMGDQTDWERIWASKNDKVAFWGYLIPLTITLILLLIPTYIGIFQRPLFPSGMAEEYLIYGFIFEKLAPSLALFVIITLVSAIMSSADSYMIGSGQIFSNDIIKRFISRQASDKEMIFWTRMGVILTGTVGFAFAINISNIIYLWIAGIGIGTVLLVPAYFALWFSKRVNGSGVLAGMASALFFCMYVLITNNYFDSKSVFAGALINLGTCAIVSIMTKEPMPEVVERTFYFSDIFKE